MIITQQPLLWEATLTQALEHRVGVASDELLDYIVGANVNASNLALAQSCPEFILDIQTVMAELPGALKEKLEPKLLGIYVMTGLDSSAVTDVVFHPDGHLIGAFVAVDAHAFIGRSANEWATWKENDPFLDHPAKKLALRIADETEDDAIAAIRFILLHEFGHVMAADSHLLPNWWEETPAQSQSYPFLDLCWQYDAEGTITPTPDQDFPLRGQVAFYRPDKLSAAAIAPVYQQLENTLFPTLYAAMSVHEDFAESFATYVHCVLLKQPWELCLLEDQRIIARYPDFWSSARSDAKRAFFDAFFDEELPLSSQRQHHAAIARTSLDLVERVKSAFLGLAPFLRLSIAMVDLRYIGNAVLEATGSDQGNPLLWMNLSTIFFAMEQKQLGLSMQAEALSMQRLFCLPASRQPAKVRLLMIVVAGDLSQNTPLDCLLEDTCIDLIFYFATPEQPFPPTLPEHDVVMAAISYNSASQVILTALEAALLYHDKPVINLPHTIARVERKTASRLLQGVPGLSMPLTHRAARFELEAIAAETVGIADFFGDGRFPVIVRPTWSHAGHFLEKIESPAGLSSYLTKVPEDHFYISNFIDYSGADGMFRKYRIALVEGVPFICHAAISSHWMIHYVNAGMYDDHEKRLEEGVFMENFPAFADTHKLALAAVHQRSGLDYVCIDCAQARDGSLLIFEIEHAMVVHAMDSEQLFPNKQGHIRKLKQAVESLVLSRMRH